MPNYTEFLNLEKPLQSEQYNVDVFNSNCDKIDNFAKSQIVPIATTETVGIVKPDGTTITVQADGTISSIAGDDFADQDINNLTTLGNARLQYAPFAINAGTVINGNNHTLQSGSFIQSYTEAGTYTIEITEAGNYEIEMYGAGGGWARGSYTVYGGRKDYTIATGGSGAGFKGVLNLPVGIYSVTVGAGGTYVSGGRGTTGGNTNFNNIISANGATGGYSIHGGYAQDIKEKGIGGSLQIIDSSYIVSTSKQMNGRDGSYNTLTEAYPYMAGATSVYDDTITGYGAGGGSSHEAVDGYFKITKLTGDASKIFCDPCTITTTDGRTKIFDTASSIDVSSDMEYKKYNFAEVGTLTKNKNIISGFSASNYIKLLNSFAPESNTWEIQLKVKTGNSVSTLQNIFSKGFSTYYGIRIDIDTTGHFYYLVSSSSGSSSTIIENAGATAITTNTDYWLNLSFDGSKYLAQISTDGVNWQTDYTKNSTDTLYNFTADTTLGYGLARQAIFTGEIDVAQCYIKINNQITWQGVTDGTSSDYDYTFGATYEGSYSIFKDYETGELSLIDEFVIGKTNPSGYRYNINEVGILTKNNGIVSGFSSSNYATITPKFIPQAGDNWEVVMEFTTGSDVSTQGRVWGNGTNAQAYGYYGTNIYVYQGSVWVYLNTTNGRQNLTVCSASANTTYRIKFNYDGSIYKTFYSNGDDNYIEGASYSNSNPLQINTSHQTYIGYDINEGYAPFTGGSINLANSYIKLNGENFWQGALYITPTWLDSSTTPANLKVNGVINNDLVYIGDCTILNGGVTALENRYFNACPYHRDLVDSYQNGSSWYALYSDGWCEQGGEISLSGNAWQTISFLKPFKDANYQVLTSIGYHTTGGMEPIIYNNKTTISVQILSDNQSSRKFSWQAKGYTA